MSVPSLLAALAIFLAPVSDRSRVEFTEDSLEDVMENLAEERAVLVDVRPGAGSGEVEVVYTVFSLGRTHTVPGRGRIVGDRLSAEIAYGQGIGLTLTGPGRADGEYRGYAPAGVADGQFVRE